LDTPGQRQDQRQSRRAAKKYDYCWKHMQLCFCSEERYGLCRSGEAVMAITIRNKRLEERIRRLGEIHGEGPSATIGRLVDREVERLSAGSEEERIARRRKSMDEWIASLPLITDEERHEMDRLMDDMYDENGLPK
jgi:hypothetical protein